MTTIDSQNVNRQTATTYGSTEENRREGGYYQGEADAQTHNNTFSEDNLRFLPAGWSSLSNEEKRRKMLLLGCPIVIAIAIIGGAAYFLTRDFGDLYPGEDNSKPSFHTFPNPAPAKHPTPPPAPSPKTDLPDSSCALVPNCAMLEGLCCPTSEGVMLDCCTN
ncbi:hypothetical protein ACA910_008173 [Epithemia clementina (nom. ined.)]